MILLLTVLKNLFFRGVVFALITCIPGLWDSVNCRLCCTISTFCVLCHPYDSLTQGHCLPSVSFQIHGTRRAISAVSFWLRCPSFGISCSASDGVANFTDFFSSSRHSAKGRDNGMCDPSVTHCCGALAAERNGTWANVVPCPEKNRNFSLADLKSVKLPLASLLDSGGQCLYFILLRWLGTGQVPHLIL